MSEAIEDMEICNNTSPPYMNLVTQLQGNNFYKNSYISYDQNQIRVHSKQELDNSFSLLIKIIAKTKQLSLQAYLIKNAEYFIINSREIRKILYRSFFKTVGIDQNVQILINQEGRIMLKMYTYLTQQLEFKSAKHVYKIEKLIQQVCIKMIDIFHTVFKKLKILIEPVYQKTLANCQEQMDKIELMKIACRFLEVQTAFIKKDDLRGKDDLNLSINIIDEKQLDLTDIFQLKVSQEKIKDSHQKLKFCTSTNRNLQKNEDRNTFSLLKLRPLFKTYFKSPQLQFIQKKVQVYDGIYPKIFIVDPQNIEWVKFHEGGFGYLYKANVIFFFINENNETKKYIHEKPINRQMAMKIDKNNGKFNRIQAQKHILRSLKSKKSSHLPQYYESSQIFPRSTQFILSDFYPQKSLQLWLRNYGQFQSIFTRILIIIQICSGLEFLHENGIIHRDLKISNMLVDSKIVIKIIDFGQSYLTIQSPYSKGKDYRPGFTLPNSPPEALGKDETKLEKKSYDIFSLGLIIYEVLVGKSLFHGMSQTELKDLYLKQAKNMALQENTTENRWKSFIKQKIYLIPQLLTHYGCIQLLSPLLYMIQRCLDPKIQNRPQLDWIIFIIKQTHRRFLDFYSL